MHKFLSLSFVLFALSACGFSPVYGTLGQNQAVEQSFAHIQIDRIPDREGQFLKNALIDRLHRNGADQDVRYRLSIDPVKEDLDDLDITKDSETTRGQLRLQTSMKLIDTRDQNVLLTRNLTAIASYNILDSEFSTRVSEDNTRLNALNDLARQIEQQLALYFKR